MSDEKDSQLPPVSPSDSHSQDALDSASARRLTDGLRGLTLKVDEAKRDTSELGNRIYFLEREVRAAMRQATADRKAFEAFVERALRANREVAESEHQAIAGAVRTLDDTSKNLLLPRETDEQVIKRVAVTRFGPWLIKQIARHGLFFKILGWVSLAGAALWAFFRNHIHHF